MKSPVSNAVFERARPSAAQQLLAFAETLLLALWLGSMVFFSFAVAPTAFAVLPTRHLAGQLVSSLISKLELMGLAIGPLLILLQAGTWKARRSGALTKALGIVLVLVMTASTVVSRLWISPALASLRSSMGEDIERLALTDPVRVQFDSLHQYSVASMSVTMFAGLVLLVLTTRAWLRR